MDPYAAGLLGRVGGLLARDPEVLDVRPVLSAHGHEVIGLRVTTADGVFELTAAAAHT